MPILRDAAFERLAVTVEENVGWHCGAGSEWECGCNVGPTFLGDLVRLAFEAPQSDRDEFIAKYAQ